jgi:hypothetical protein
MAYGVLPPQRPVLLIFALMQALRAAHNRSLEVLAEAEARLQEEQAAKAGRVAKAQQAAEEKAAAAALAAKQLAAAIQIQAAWRGYKVGARGRLQAQQPTCRSLHFGCHVLWMSCKATHA